MNFKRTPKPGDASLATPGALHAGGGAHLSLYKDMPMVDISLEEFERFALDRLRGALSRRMAHAHALEHVFKALLACVHERTQPAAPTPCCCRHSSSGLLSTSPHSCQLALDSAPGPHAVLKAMEEGKLRGKSDETMQVGEARVAADGSIAYAASRHRCRHHGSATRFAALQVAM